MLDVLPGSVRVLGQNQFTPRVFCCSVPPFPADGGCSKKPIVAPRRAPRREASSILTRWPKVDRQPIGASGNSMNPAEGKVAGIAIRLRSRGPMEEFDAAEITQEQGVLNDSRGRPGKRQVTVLAAEDWKTACASLDKELSWTSRRANLLIEGLSLRESTGSIICAGDARLEVTGETDPCSRMDEIEPGLQNALKPDWRAGVCCRVLRGGTIAIGTPVTMQIPDD